MSYKRAIIFTAQDVQDEEYLYPYYRLLEDGFDLDVHITQAKKGLYNPSPLGKYGIPIRPAPGKELLGDLPLKVEHDIIIIPGGWAPEIVRMNQDVLQYIAAAHHEGKIIGAVCHGPQVLISVGNTVSHSASPVYGHKITGYVGIKDDIENAGADYHNQPVVKSGNIITSPHYRDMPIWIKTILDEYKIYVARNYVVA